MRALFLACSLIMGVVITLTIRDSGPAVILCVLVAMIASLPIRSLGIEPKFLVRIFWFGLLLRVAAGTFINGAGLEEFFGGDALTYDTMGFAMLQSWSGDLYQQKFVSEWVTGAASGWGMMYLVGAIYGIVGRNLLAVQYFNAVIGALTAPIIFLCAQHIYSNLRVAKVAAIAVAVYPSLVLWSSQALKDGPIVFLLAVAMLATLKLGEHLTAKYFGLLVVSLACLISMRFYVFYMALVAIAGSFIIGMRPISSRSLMRQLVVIVGIGLTLTYFGVLRRSGAHIEVMNLQQVQTSRADQAGSQSGFARDVDVSTTSGALSAIPVGMVYLLFAPFPWQLANLRQMITLPEMLLWWAAFPALVLGIWFTLKFRLRRALPIVIFTIMLTLAYSVFQGNVGTAYRQRSQVLVFYFIFVAVGGVLIKEQREDRARSIIAEKQALATAIPQVYDARTRHQRWKDEREKGMDDLAPTLSERINF